jgi:hypothetical protein
MLVCLAIMAVAMPLGLRVVRRIRGAAAATLPDPNTSGSQQAPDPPMRPGPRPQRDVPEVAVGNNTAEVTEHTKVLVVGGSQAGLVASYYLSHAQVPHLVLDGERRVGDAWRRRWDSLELFSAACYSALPGLRFPGDPEHFPGKDEVADYLEAYAHTYQLPVKLHARVRFLQASDGGYRVDTDAGAYQAQQVIVATGAYQQLLIPQLAAKLSDDVVQLHSAQYRNPQQLASNFGTGGPTGLHGGHDSSPHLTVLWSGGPGHPRWPRGRSADQLVGSGGCLPRKRGGTPSSGTCGSWWSASWGCTPPPANSLARGSFSPYPPARQDVAPQVHCSTRHRRDPARRPPSHLGGHALGTDGWLPPRPGDRTGLEVAGG